MARASIPLAWHRRLLPALVFGALAVVCAAPLAAQEGPAQELEEKARMLARQIAVSVGAGRFVALEVRNASSLSAAEVQGIEAALAAELAEEGLHVRAGPAGTPVRVTLAESVSQRVWSAEMFFEGQRDVALVTLARPDAATPPPSEAAPRAAWWLERTLLVELPEPILDAGTMGASSGAGGRLLVLTPQRVLLFASEGGAWRQRGAQAVSVAGGATPHSPRRDPRGRLVIEDGTFWAHLPGLICGGVVAPAFSMACRTSAEPWPLAAGAHIAGYAAYVAERNHFAGVVITPHGYRRDVPPFFSVAAVGEEEARAWWMAGVDGRVHWLGAGSASSPPAELGSDLASVYTSCGGRWQVLATLGGERGLARRVQAFGVYDGALAPLAGPLELEGEVTALWTAAGGAAAVVVVRNRESELYAAYRLAIRCRR